MEINFILLIVSVIIILGYLAEWLFKKTGIPDTLFLIIIGFVISPNVLGIIRPESIDKLAPLFTTFTLLFLMFDGALYIDLKSFTEGIGSGIFIGLFNYCISTVIITGIFYFFIQNLLISLILGFSLGGVSAAYIISLLKQIETKKRIYSILTLESAITDVLSIVFALTMIELNILNAFNLRNVFSQVASLFSVAGFVGILAGFLWIFLERKIVQKDKNYIVTISYVILVFVAAEYLGGNGAIAALFLGITIANSKMFILFLNKIKRKKEPQEGVPQADKSCEKVVTSREKLFYNEISFFLKTFFFVYIGLLLDLTNLKAIYIGFGIAVLVMLFRNFTSLLTKKYDVLDRKLINSLFARGIAPAAIILTAIEKNVINDQMVIDAVYLVITATIILSSLRVFILQKSKLKNKE